MKKESRLTLTLDHKNALLIHKIVKVFVLPSNCRGKFKVIIEAPREVEIDRIPNIYKGEQ